MPTLKDRVEKYVGAISDSDLVSQFLKSSTRAVVNAIDISKIEQHASFLVDSGSGVSVANARVIAASKGGYMARRIPASFKGIATSGTSIFGPSASDPVWYTEGGMAYVVGATAGGNVQAVVYDSPLYSAESIAGFPADADHLVILHAAAQVAYARGLSEALPVQDAELSTPTVPTLTVSALTPPTYGPPAMVSLPDSPDVPALTLPSAPSAYVSPSVTLPTLPTIGTLDLSGITAPTPPSALSIAYGSGTTATNETTVSIPALPTPPTLSTVSFGGSLSLPSLPAELDLSTDLDGVTAIAVPTTPSAPTLSSAGITTVTMDLTNSLANVPTFTAPTTELDFTAYDAYESDHDADHAAVILQKIALQLQEVNQEFQEAVTTYQRNVEVFRAHLAKAQDDARLLMEERQAELQATDSMTMATWQASLARFQGDFEVYNAKVQRKVEQTNQRYQRAISAWDTQQRLYLQLMATQSEQAATAFSGAMQDHMAEVSRVVDTVRMEQERLNMNARLTTDAGIQNAIHTTQVEISEYEANVRRYATEATVYSAKVEAAVQEFVINNIQHALAKYAEQGNQVLSKYNVDVQNSSSAARLAIEAYSTEAQTVLSEYQAKTGRDLSDYQVTFDGLIKAYVADLETAVKDFEAETGRFQMSLAQAQSNNESKIAIYQVDSAVFNARIQHQASRLQQASELFIAAKQGYGTDGDRLMALFQQQLSYYNGNDATQPNRDPRSIQS